MQVIFISLKCSSLAQTINHEVFENDVLTEYFKYLHSDDEKIGTFDETYCIKHTFNGKYIGRIKRSFTLLQKI